MALVIATWISDALETVPALAAYEIECDDDSAIFGDVVSCVSGTVVS